MNILIMARFTFKEASRRKIAVTALLLGLAFLFLYSLGFHYIRQQTMNVRTIYTPEVFYRQFYNLTLIASLYVVNFLTIAMAALVTTDTLSGEISSGTIQSLLARPVRRSEIVAGKWLGYALLIGLYVLLMAGGVILSTWLQSGYLPPNILPGLGLMLLEGLMMVSITVACSSTFSTLATGGVVFGLYGVAFVGGWVEQIGSYMNSVTAVQIGVVSSLLMPSEALWRRAAYEMTSPLVSVMAGGPFTSRSVPSPLMVAYAGFYLLLALFIAIRRFGKRDL